jgi:hypothetical protein
MSAVAGVGFTLDQLVVAIPGLRGQVTGIRTHVFDVILDVGSEELALKLKEIVKGALGVEAGVGHWNGVDGNPHGVYITREAQKKAMELIGGQSSSQVASA